MKKFFKVTSLLLLCLMVLGACTPAATPGTSVVPSTAISATPAADASIAPAVDATAAPDYTSQLLKAGTIVVGTSPDYPPYESLDATGKLVGFDIEMMEAVAASMGLTVQWSKMDFDPIIIALQAGQIDVGVSSFTYAKDRDVLFSSPYLVSAQVAIVQEASAIQTHEDLKGKKLYAGLGTTGEEAVDAIENVQKVTSLDYQVAFEMLKQGQLDGVVCDLAVGKNYVDQGIGLRMIEPVLADENNHVIVRKGNDALVAAINTAIDQYITTPEYTALREKFGL